MRLRRLPRFVLKTIAYAWASPYTLCGLALGVLLRGNFRIHTGVVEIHGPRVTWFLTRCLPIAALAWTVGHAVLAHSPAAHDLTRAHERVHVRQFAVLGPFMGPAYLLASLYAWIRGGDAYRDNWFEKQAFRVS